MLINTLINIFERDLNRLINEIELYKNENDIWKIKNGISNSGGNLCLHLIGNLNAFIGKELGSTNYVRNRELEFSLKNIPRQELISMLYETIAVVKESLSQLSNEELENQYPILVLSEKTTTGYFLVHLATHLTYHLGQVNYHRRLLEN
jgi:hypothetical protein